MARTIPAAVATEVAKKTGTEPLIIIEIDWGGSVGIKRYADRLFDTIPGKILSVGDIDAVVKAQGAGSSGVSLSVVLDDTDGSLKTVMNTIDVHKRPAKVYQSYGNLTFADKFLLLSGDINSPFSWSESNRTFSFDIIAKTDEKEVGFSPEQGEFEFIAESAVGKAWPLCFGNPIRVPAVKITERTRGRSLTRYGLVSRGNLNLLCNSAEALADAEDAKEIADSNAGISDETYATTIEALTTARITLDTNLTALIFDSPNQADDLKRFAEVCKELRRLDNEAALLASQILSLDNQIEAAQQGIQDLEDQIIVEQNAANPDLDLITLLKDTKAGLENDLTFTEATRQSLLTQLNVVNASRDLLNAEKETLVDTLTQFVLEEIIVDGGEDFPQGVEVQVIVNSLRLSGIFNDQVFTINSVLPTVENIDTIPSPDSENEFDVPELVDIRQLYCFIPNRGIVFIQEQDNQTCRHTPLLYEQIGTLGELFGVLVNGEPAEREVYDFASITSISQASPIIFKSWLDLIEALEIPDFASGVENAARFDWGLEIGDEVLLDEDFTDIYIANLIPSTEIKEVLGRRTINGVLKLVPIPTQLYKIDLNESIAGQNSTTIRFIRPLSHFVDQNWTGEVFVTLVSSEGPNTADVIQYLAETYTDLVIDAASFATVQSQLTNYPSHFALLTRRNALAVIDEIAWQARCAVFVKNNVLFIKYLAAEEAALQDLTESDITDLEITFTSSEDLVTKFKAIWKRDLSEEEDSEVVLRNNIGKYGLFEQEFNFFIYNIEELVVKSATFWLIRYSNTWKIARFKAFLDTLQLEVFDTMTITLVEDIITGGSAKGILKRADYDSANNEMVYELETSIRLGETAPYVFYWPATAPAGAEYPTEDDLYAGGGS